MFDVIGKGKRFLQRNKRRIIHVWQTMWAKRHYYTSLQSYVYECPNKAKILSLRVDNVEYASKDDNISLEPGGQVIVKKARLNDVTCFVFSDILLLADCRCLYDIKELDFLHSIADFTDEILLKDTQHWCKLKKCHQQQNITKAIKIGGMFGFNYYHFMFQLLPRMLEIADIDPSIPLLLDYSARDVPSMKQLVDWCNTVNREIIYMEYDVAYCVNELYYITSPHICVPNLKQENVKTDVTISAYSRIGINSMVEKLLSLKSVSFPQKDKIFISRRSSKRRKYNEDELWSVAKSSGFEMVFPEELSMAEQIALFNNAKIIIAANGAALTNLIFCCPSSMLVIFCSSSMDSSLFSSLMLMREGKVIEIYNDKISKGYQGNYHIDPMDLEKALETICN